MDHFLRAAGGERATIEMMEDVPESLSFENLFVRDLPRRSMVSIPFG